jgi:putative ABC transport system permease protein
LLALLISSLGLFGLAAFTAEQRTKEVGIRKVLGASVRSLVLLLTKDFLRMVVWAFFLATPVAWYVMHQWLEDFAYRIHLQWWMFMLPGILALLVAWLTVGFQSIKAAIINPVDSLRNE